MTLRRQGNGIKGRLAKEDRWKFDLQRTWKNGGDGAGRGGGTVKGREGDRDEDVRERKGSGG